MQESIEVLAQVAVLLVGATLTLACVLSKCRRPPSSARARRVGPYLLSTRIGSGAMGEVYRARHVVSGRLYALKLLSSGASARQKVLFDNEVLHGARLSHPGNVSAQDHGQARDGTRYFAMELVEGISLRELVEREGPQAPQRVVDILLQVCSALAEVHELGLVHCDIKPDNLVLCRGVGGDRVRLLDFGLVKRVGEAHPEGDAGHAVGTPLYISPEALTSPAAMDGRSDLYGLGAVAYHLLCGAPPFSGGSLLEVFSQHLIAAPEPLSNLVDGSIPSELESLVLECLAKTPSARPGSARELERRLRRLACFSGETRGATPASLPLPARRGEPDAFGARAA